MDGTGTEPFIGMCTNDQPGRSNSLLFIQGVYTRLKASEWLILIAGALVVVVSFTWDYSGYILERYSLSDIWNMPLDGSLLEYAAGYIPRSFNWWLFGAGNLVVVSAIILIYRRFRLKS